MKSMLIPVIFFIILSFNKIYSQVIFDTILTDNVQNIDFIKTSDGNYIITWADLNIKRNINYITINNQFKVNNNMATISNTNGFFVNPVVKEFNGNYAFSWLSVSTNFDIPDLIISNHLNNDTINNSQDFVLNDLVNTEEIENRSSPQLVFINDTTYLVVWVDFLNEGRAEVRGKLVNILNPNEYYLKTDILFSDTLILNINSDIRLTNNNSMDSFLMSWSGIYNDSSKIFYRKFNSNLTLQLSSIYSISNNNKLLNGGLIQDKNGNYVSAIFESDVENKYNLYVLKLSSDLKIIKKIKINDEILSANDVSLDIDEIGEIIVVWQNYEDNSIMGQRFDVDFNKIENNFFISEPLLNNNVRQFSPITLLNENKIITAWIYGNEPYFIKLKVLNFENPVSIEYSEELNKESYSLFQNYPNPFNPLTTISYQIPNNAIVILKVYDVLGQEITTLVNEYKTSGKYSIKLDASSLTSGIYFYKISSGIFCETKKFILIK